MTTNRERYKSVNYCGKNTYALKQAHDRGKKNPIPKNFGHSAA
jgi:hypothetical protein